MSKIMKQSKSDHQSSSNTLKVRGMLLPRNLQQLESKQGQSRQIQSVISGTDIHRCRLKCDNVADDGSNAEKKPEDEKENSDSTLRGASLLTAIRKRALEEGMEIGKEEKSLMLNIFQSSLPKRWIND
ncbi:hypothetical protein ACJRO7_002001 [Eucalyptus globulus]|uniref:Uncharacterized protein n=1 Tax=Eucalyptus globulus TaxID=34317 RepID=A0ABD3LST9_EUCGL